MTSPKTDQPKAYSYLRFSTPEQQKGDSFRRQLALATGYADSKGLQLDDKLTYHDLGVSAYRGDNQSTGRLGEFLAGVQAGEVPSGSYLLVESLDRLSRQSAFDAQIVLSQIIQAGITVVTLIDYREYSAETVRGDPMALIYAILTFTRANEESETKSRRLKEAWKNKRARMVSEGRLLTNRLPGWLRFNDARDKLEFIPERAELVQSIFEKTIEGKGHHKIADEFNKEGIPPWGSSDHWQRTYIAKILKNPAVLGIFTPHTLEYEGNKRARKALAPVDDYFPRVVSDDDWKHVRALEAGNRAPSRGRHAKAPISNILAGLAVCSLCGRTVTRVNKGKKSVPHLVCVAAKRGLGCSYQTVKYECVEDAVLSRLNERLTDIPAGTSGTLLDDQVDKLERNLSGLEQMLDHAFELELKAPSSHLTDKRRQIETEVDELRHFREKILTERAHTSGRLVAWRVDTLAESLSANEPDIPALNAAIRALFKRVVVDQGEGRLEFEWTHGGTLELYFGVPKDLAPA